MKVLIKGCFLCDPCSGWEGPAEILVKEGKIEAVAPSIEGVDAPVMDIKGCYVFPGLVDMHVHLREPGGESKETVFTGCAAAVAGGFASVACMPNTSPPLDRKETMLYVQQRAASAGLARVYPIGALTKELRGLEPAPLWELAREGARGFSDDGRPVKDGGVLYKIMQWASLLGLPVISHCEELSLSAGGAVHAGPCGYRMGLPVIPSCSEAVIVARELLLNREVKGKLHLAHISCKESVELLGWARERGIDFTAEVTPHHLLLTEEAVESFNTDAKMNPPLRSPEDRDSLLQALRDGLINIIATDHAPHTSWEKEKDFLNAPFGVVGLETALPLLWTELVEKKLLSPLELAGLMSLNPAKALGVPGGTLAPGSPADLVVVDANRESEVAPEKFFSRGRNTPFKGWKVKGLPVLTMVEGDVKMYEGLVKGFSENFPSPAELFSEAGGS